MIQRIQNHTLTYFPPSLSLNTLCVLKPLHTEHALRHAPVSDTTTVCPVIGDNTGALVILAILTATVLAKPSSLVILIECWSIFPCIADEFPYCSEWLI